MVFLDVATLAEQGNLNGVLIIIGGGLILGLIGVIWFMIKKYISNQENVNKELIGAITEFKLIANEVQHAQKDITRVEKDYKDHLNTFHAK